MLKPTGIFAPHGADTFRIEFSDGKSFRIPHRVLRGYCPCAGCQGHSGIIRFVEPSQGASTSLRDLERVGAYALGLSWGDGHSTGIYSFEYLRHLGTLVETMGAGALEALPSLPRLEGRGP